eukprot:1424932-Pyramimonas_sp.AAC.1
MAPQSSSPPPSSPTAPRSAPPAWAHSSADILRSSLRRPRRASGTSSPPSPTRPSSAPLRPAPLSAASASD